MLASGTKLGPYEIQCPLGAGGMGEVYRARDTRLDRTVAIKILPEHLADNAEARQRFDREARSISGLSHPNICTLYDVGHQDGVDFLVMEYLEGETLADRLLKGPLPADQLLKCAVEICEGLGKAHNSGVVHRDLKPGNIMLTKSGVKLMDFGLAKAASQANPLSSGLTATLVAPAANQPLTAQGMIVGTFQYMAPEQIEGKDADARSDIFALGAVLYEMATGKRAFAGKTTASVFAAILASEPQPLTATYPMLPALEQIIRVCLAKDPAERWQSVHDVKLQLRGSAVGGSQVTPQMKVVATRRERTGWLLASVLLLLLLGVGGAWWASSRRAPSAMYFTSTAPFPANNLALSPDGRALAMVAYSDQGNKYVIWTQEVGGRAPVVLPGTEDASHPFWSRDGRWIGFFSQNKLKKVDVHSGRSAQVLCDASGGRGGTWNRDGIILFGLPFGPLYRVSASGGTPVAATKLDPSRAEASDRWPVFLPDQKHFLYLGANFSGQFDKNSIYVGSLDSEEKKFVVSASSNAAYADPGYLLYLRDDSLVAQRFDSSRFVLSGEPHTLADGVQYSPQIDLAVYHVQGGSTLVVQTGRGAARSQLLWFDRSGRQVGSVGPPGLYANPSLSPDGQRVAVDQIDNDGRHVNVWIHGLANDAVARLGFDPWLEQVPVWSPDGKKVAYSSNQKLHFTLHVKNADGSGSDEEIADLASVQQNVWSWSRDGRYMLAKKGAELWYLTLSDRQARQLFEGRPVTNAQFSPDGKWIAYSTDETGTPEIYVAPFPGLNGRWQVSRGGGLEPRWRRDGKELFYLSEDGKLMAVTVKTGGTFEAEPPHALFQTRPRQPISSLDVFSYDVNAEGSRFLINTKVDTASAAPPSIILNWESEMEK